MYHNRISSSLPQAAAVSGSPRQLTTGMIVQGQVLKLYPNQKALIQIGGQQMVAQLEASLTIGQRYQFQAQVTDQTVVLKVLGEGTAGGNDQGIQSMLQKLGLSVGKGELLFVKSLFNENIPFQKDQLKAALAILNQSGGKPEAAQILKTMLVNKLPVTQAVFEALAARETGGLGSKMQELLEAVRSSSAGNVRNDSAVTKTDGLQNKSVTGQATGTGLLTADRLNSVGHSVLAKGTEGKPFVQPVVNSMMDGNQALTSVKDQAAALLGKMSDRTQFVQTFLSNQIGQLTTEETTLNLLKSAGTVSQNVRFSDWQAEWKHFVQQTSALPQGQMETALQKLPFGLTEQKLLEGLSNGLTREQNVRQAAAMILERFGAELKQANQNQQALDPAGYAKLERQVQQRLLPELPQQAAAELKKVLGNNQPGEFKQLLRQLEQLASSQTAEKLQPLLSQMNEKSLVQLQPKELFLAQLKQIAEESGVAHERMIAEGKMEQAGGDLKAALLKLAGSDDAAIREPSRQLVHLINGLQLQTVQESGHFLQAALQMPGSVLGIPGDMKVEFEGKKEADGKLNPEFCRVLFYLNLEHLEDTVIDMHVQKRNVSVTIYNNHELLPASSGVWEALLGKGLEGLGYRLASLTVKSMNERAGSSNQPDQAVSAVQNGDAAYRKVDFRI